MDRRKRVADGNWRRDCALLPFLIALSMVLLVLALCAWPLNAMHVGGMS